MQHFVIALVGQKNVGKSTLFNKLTNTNSALVSKYPGFTRDRRYGYLNCKFFKSIVIDTGGLSGFDSHTDLTNYVLDQTVIAIKESDIVLFIVDGHMVDTSIDYSIVSFLRKLKKNIFIVVNKIDNFSSCVINDIYRFHVFGIKNFFPISATHGYGLSTLLKKLSYTFYQKIKLSDSAACTFEINKNDICVLSNQRSKKNYLLSVMNNQPNVAIKLAVIGRPNSGKSTFVNYVIGEHRMITCSNPGTTRDSIDVCVTYNKQQYVLIDTAGLRNKNRIYDVAEQISILNTFNVMKSVHIILFLIDAKIGIVERDLSLLKNVIHNSKGLVIVINKWDVLSDASRNEMKSIWFRKISSMVYDIRIHYVSALYGYGIENLFKSIQEIYKFTLNIHAISTARLTRIMYEAITQYPPPFFCGKRIRPKYVHFGGSDSTIIIVHGTNVSKLTNSYKRYLKKFFYKFLKVYGVIFHFYFKDSNNPFGGKKKIL